MADTKGKLYPFEVKFRELVTPGGSVGARRPVVIQAAYLKVQGADYLLNGVDHQTVFGAPSDMILSVVREEDVLEEDSE